MEAQGKKKKKRKKYATMGEYVGGNMISVVHRSREMFK